MVGQWLALLSQSKNVLDSNPPSGTALSVWSLYFLCGYCGFLPQYKETVSGLRLTHKLPKGGSVIGCPSFCVSPVVDL